ncbi:MAG: NAD(P)-dependent oxidoreductase [Chloroflexi bacterium]|nr:NAD(P)-dependent oxidoreductase [Chloroflexota bacterium]
MSKVGFIGLGLIGKPMCMNLVKKGFDVTCWNRTTSKMEDVVAAGAKPAESAKEAAEGNEFTITMVNDSPDVEEVILGPSGVMEGADEDSVVIDMSTISPSVTREIACKLAGKGVHMLDGPVSGGITGAESGTLSIMVGGDGAILERSMHVLEGMGTRITHCGGNGMGQVTKLANNITGQGTLAAVTEGLVFAAKHGADLETTLSALGGGAAQSWMLENLGARMCERDFAPGFMVDTAQKDMRLILQAAEEMNVALPVTALVTQIFRSAQEMGYGEDGTQAYAKVMETLTGTRLER